MGKLVQVKKKLSPQAEHYQNIRGATSVPVLARNADLRLWI